MNFNIDESIISQSIIDAMEETGRQISEDQFVQIANKINSVLPDAFSLIIQSVKEFWVSEARSRGGWGEKYAAAIRSKVQGNKAEIYVDETTKDKTSNKPLLMFANMIEEGVKSWSIKDALLASEKAKTSSDGIKYMVIPFPVATPRKPSAGKGQSAFGGREMTAEMHKIVKAGGTLKSGTLKSGSREIDVSGLTKFQTRQRHEQYGIFRAISEKSSGWIHPGKGADPVYPDVLEYAERQIQRIISDFCRAVVKEYSK